MPRYMNSQTTCKLLQSYNPASPQHQWQSPTHHCKCFASGFLCSKCNCMNCHNDEEHERERHNALKAGMKCSISCACVDCWNYRVDVGAMSAQDTRPGSLITSAVLEAVCGSLLAQAELAEDVDLTAAQAERLVLEEFGRCLIQITEAMFND